MCPVLPSPPGLSPTCVYSYEETRLQLLRVYSKLHNLWIVIISDFKHSLTAHLSFCPCLRVVLGAKNPFSLMQIPTNPLPENQLLEDFSFFLFFCLTRGQDAKELCL